jgi:hypothetical protein
VEHFLGGLDRQVGSWWCDDLTAGLGLRELEDGVIQFEVEAILSGENVEHGVDLR